MGFVKSDEKRQYRRLDFKQATHFSFKDPSIFGDCLSCDISEGGIRLSVTDFVPLHTEMYLTVNFESGQILECMARVMWVQKYRFMDRYEIGLQFHEQDSIQRSQEMIRSLIVSG